jgi:hypothetical protein
MRELSPIEARVLGTLMEKARTVPDSYPLSINSLLSGCNQKTSREPLMEISEEQAQQALQGLRSLSLVFEAAGARVPRYEHNTQRGLAVDEAQAVLLGLLILRGAQTPAELRANAERWYKFADGAAVEAVLQTLKTRGDEGGAAYVALLPKAPGAREARWVHLLCGMPDISQLPAHSGGAADEASLLARVTTLEAEALRQESHIAALQAQLGALCEQLGLDASEAKVSTASAAATAADSAASSH